MRVLLSVLLGLILLSGRGQAQEDNVSAAASALQSVLANLKDSVQKMSVDNDQLAARDKNMQEKILELRGQLGRLESQGNMLNKASAPLQDKDSRRSQQIAQLEKENFDLDDHIQKDQAGIKSVQQSLDAGYREDQKLLLQLKGLSNVLPQADEAQSPDAQAAALHQKEKLKLMKMISDSQQRQEALHESILALQQNVSLQPAASAMARQQLLKEQIKDMQEQLAAYPSENTSRRIDSNQWSDAQLEQVEEELKALEKNYMQLKDLMGQMSQKAQASRPTVGQQLEAEKLQGKITELDRQSGGLRVDLDDLRSQMIDLDKRKSRLEVMIKKLP